LCHHTTLPDKDHQTLANTADDITAHCIAKREGACQTQPVLPNPVLLPEQSVRHVPETLADLTL
jgi:hypothetical protein